MTKAGFQIIAADGVEGYSSPDIMHNNSKFGDGQDKQPDIVGYHAASGRYANGEVKIGNDIVTEHSKTQFALFSKLCNARTRVASTLFIGIPTAEKERLDSVLRTIGTAANLSNIRIVTF